MHAIAFALVALSAVPQAGFVQSSYMASTPVAVMAAELPPPSWAPQDPADSLWRAARTRLDNGDARAAANLYRRLATEPRFARSEYRTHALYWEAFARQRIGGRAELRRGLEALALLRRQNPRFENMVEVDRLEGRISSDLAALGDAPAGARSVEAANAAASAQCPDQEIRVMAVEALIGMPAEQALPALRALLARKDECSAPLREKAVFIVAQNRSGEAEDLLLNAAKNDPSAKVRESAVFWLSQVDSEKAVEAIDEILRSSSDPKVIEGAVFALSQHRSPRAAALLRDIANRQSTPKEARKNAIFWLGQSRSMDAASLRSLYNSVNDQELKEAVLFGMSQRSEDNSDFLLEIAVSRNEPIELRKTALFWAGQKRAVSLAKLGELYRSMPDREMREQVIFALSQRREPEAVERMIEIARNEKDVELRKNVIFWLGQSRDPRAVRYLAEIIGG